MPTNDLYSLEFYNINWFKLAIITNDILSISVHLHLNKEKTVNYTINFHNTETIDTCLEGEACFKNIKEIPSVNLDYLKSILLYESFNFSYNSSINNYKLGICFVSKNEISICFNYYYHLQLKNLRKLLISPIIFLKK